MPTKQTVAEAAEAYRESKFTHMCREAFAEGFEAGAAWQKQQGIDWISVKDALPEPKVKHVARWDSEMVLTTDGEDFHINWLVFTQSKEPTGWWRGKRPVTHFAYINLPSK